MAGGPAGPTGPANKVVEQLPAPTAHEGTATESVVTEATASNQNAVPDLPPWAPEQKAALSTHDALAEPAKADAKGHTPRPDGGSAGTLRRAEADARELAPAYAEPGFGVLLLEKLHGGTPVQRRHTLNRMNAELISSRMVTDIAQHMVRHDPTFLADLQLTGDDQVVLDAYLEHGRLEGQNRIYLSHRGYFTFEEGILRAYSGKTANQIATMEAGYSAEYGVDVDEALTGGMFPELGHADQARWRYLRMGEEKLGDPVTGPTYEAGLEVYLNAIAGSDDEAVFAALAKAGDYQRVAAGFHEMFEVDMDPALQNALDDLLTNDDNELARLDALRAGDYQQYLDLTITGGEPSSADLAATVLGLVGSGGVSADFVRTHDNGRLLGLLETSYDPRLRGLGSLIRDEQDLLTSPAAYALQLRTVELESMSVDERVKMFSDVMAAIPAELRLEVDREFENRFGMSRRDHVAIAVAAAAPPYPGVPNQSPRFFHHPDARARLERLDTEWACGRSVGSTMLAFGSGAAEPDEFLAAYRAVPPDQREDFIERFDDAHGDDSFHQLVEQLPKKMKKAMALEIDLGRIASAESLEEVEHHVHAMIEHQRFGTDFETRASAGIMDALGQTGVLLDDSARNLLDMLHDAEHHSPAELQEAFSRFATDFTAYLGEKEVIAYNVGTTAAIAIATAPAVIPLVAGVTVGGTAAAGFLVGGAAVKVGIKNTIYGRDYSPLSWKAAGDFGKTLATEYVAGTIAHGISHGLEHAAHLGRAAAETAEGVAHVEASIGIRATLRFARLSRGFLRTAAELGERETLHLAIDVGTATSVNAAVGNYKTAAQLDPNLTP